ncbi:MAG: ABC transporter ATP-binding protein [Caldilineaceae bacterium]|nr:ABC transporter ATP-binding protein [Caldilineaceae bacterium]
MATEQATPLLETRGLTKKFGDFVANQGIDLAVYAGEVHAVLGENGAGKSTLMKSLYGFHQPSAGEIWLKGEKVTIPSPQAGRHLGIGMVFQNFTLVPAMTALENIALFLPDMRQQLDYAGIEKRMQALTARYALQVDLRRRVGTLAIGERQRLEIVKVLLSGARILIFDEPTSVLTPQEVESFFQVIQRLKADGYAILFITHKLPEVMAIADRITVLRQGAVAGRMRCADATPASIVQMMLGKAPPKPAERSGAGTSNDAGRRALVELRAVSIPPQQGGVPLSAIDFQLFAGEIVGVAGVSGSGQRELGDVILGLLPHRTGERWLDGQTATAWSPARVRRHGVACIPEDALQMGAIRGMTVAENMILGEQRNYSWLGGLIMNWGKVRAAAAEGLSQVFAAKAPRLEVLVETLSGGNLQRVVIAREVGRQPQILLAYYPARGLDIANAEAMRQLLLRCQGEGAGVLLFSEDMEELFTLSDRLIVLYQGQIVGHLRRDEFDAHRVGHLMTGGQ